MLAIALLGLSAPALAEELGAKDDAGGFWSHGRLDLRYVFRTASGDSTEHREYDQDATQDLFIEGGKGSWLRFEGSGRVHEDLDGQPRRSVFHDIYDTYGDWAHAYLYTAFAEVLDQGPLARARGGRQYYAEGVDVRFDGGLVETRPLGDAVAFTAYGGLPVHLYEASRSQDWLAGGAAELTAIPKTRVRADYVHIADYRPDLDQASAVDGVFRLDRFQEDYYQLLVTHQLSKEIRLRGQASTFGGRATRLEGEVFARVEEIELSSRAKYTAQLGAYRDLAIDQSPLADVLGAYEPYHELYFDVRKGLLDHFTVGGGLAIRELAYQADEGPFNHEFKRFFGLADVTDWPWQGLAVSFLGEWYRSDVADRTFQASVDVSQELGRFIVGAGTSYALFKFDEFFLEERERVRTTFASVEWRPVKWIRPRISYSYEDDDKDRYHVLRCDLRLSW
jgi:hypothetical protein